MPRRSLETFQSSFESWLLVAAFGSLLIIAGLVSLGFQLFISIRHRNRYRVAAGDPWDGRNLEWSTSAPPPEYNFATLPQIESRDPFYHMKKEGRAYPRQNTYQPIQIPKNSGLGPTIGVAAAALGFGLVWYIWWLAVVGLAVVIAAIIVRSFNRNTMRVISVEEIERTEARWHAVLAAAVPVSREQENVPANVGLAKFMS